MPGQELLPGGFAVALGRRFQTMLFKNVGNRAARDLVAQISQGSLYSPVAPIAVFSRHADGQLLDLVLHPGTSWATLPAAIIFPGDELAVPGQERLRRDDSGQFMKYAPAELPGLDGQSTALVIIQARPLSSELLPQHTVLFLEVVDDILLRLAQAAGERDQQQPKRI
jgi:hypothetical protein